MKQKTQRIHILGICGTFMGSLAILARQMGYQVSGSDQHCYPPMSTQLEAMGIVIDEGFDPGHLPEDLDELVIGNAMSRGNPMVEYALSHRLNYSSGPQWLSQRLLRHKWVLAVSGTHGKTTTSAMLAWILADAGLKPGYLIGGIPKNFDASANLGESDFFVIEADEYDSAFFDKRSKFIHYHAKTLIMNNLEYDHADIFQDLTAIQRQFHHLVKTVPETGQIIMPNDDLNLNAVVEQGCWTPLVCYERSHDPLLNQSKSRFITTNQAPVFAQLEDASGQHFNVVIDDAQALPVKWALSGNHNVANALSAILAARHVGVSPERATQALCTFKGVARRMEKIVENSFVSVYDDFAHHPTAIKTTLAGLRNQVADEPIHVIIEPRSNTMKRGVHGTALIQSLEAADQVLWLDPNTTEFNLKALIQDQSKHQAFGDVTEIIDRLFAAATHKQHWLIMSNGSFGGIYQKIKQRLAEQ